MSWSDTFSLVQVLFWLPLSTWFGGAVFAVVAPPVVLRVMRQERPDLAQVLSVNLEGQHGTLLAGSVLSALMGVTFRIEGACAGVLALGLVGQWVMLGLGSSVIVGLLLRTALYLAAAVFLFYQWRVLWPAVIAKREHYIVHADDPDIANPTLDEFDRLSATSLTVLQIKLFVLLGLVLFGAIVARPAVTL